jgi:hypothetical protein
VNSHKRALDAGRAVLDYLWEAQHSCRGSFRSDPDDLHPSIRTIMGMWKLCLAAAVAITGYGAGIATLILVFLALQEGG